MPKWKSSFLVILMTVAAVAQTATELESPEVNAIAAKMKCDCGCNLDMACKMPPDGRCPVCQKAKAKIVALQQAGKSDQQVLDQFVSESGKDILIIPPGIAGVVGPYVALGLGLIVVLWTIRRYMQKPAAQVAGPEIDPATLDKIEKDMAKLD